ncbi:phosphotransferase family protein [Aliikangiella sp. G2MR2-5]|uniref:phosphotransferase family protein n=1 Tax=Aliikangiella sp. G2MR2-5 TaxID=2788943 RepID=UPI0018AAE472|nr:aminoglycoside 3'-phosphotransferase/choline kinase family protein [Aliikangiella sp. G2MR2-5]
MTHLLPASPEYKEICLLLDSADDSYWRPAVEYICRKYDLSDSNASRIHEGGNLLYQIDDNLILKIVPPNWRYQGESEIVANDLLKGKLSVTIPELIHYGELDNWLYLIMRRLDGISLAQVWAKLGIANKRSIIEHLGQLMKEIHQLAVDKNGMHGNAKQIAPNWKDYYQQLKNDCVPRHQRKNVAPDLVEQIDSYFKASKTDDDSILDDLAEEAPPIFIHMDLHPWNLMVKEIDGEYKVTGILDFGDAVIGKSRLLELATPLLFMCQGNAELCRLLIESYGLLEQCPAEELQGRLMAVSLLRPACDFNFVLAQVPETAPRTSWQAIARQLFPFSDS